MCAPTLADEIRTAFSLYLDNERSVTVVDKLRALRVRLVTQKNV